MTLRDLIYAAAPLGVFFAGLLVSAGVALLLGKLFSARDDGFHSIGVHAPPPPRVSPFAPPTRGGSFPAPEREVKS